MSELQLFLPGVVLSLSAVMLALMSPGPNILAVIGTSMSTGRREGMSLSCGVALGTFVWVLLAVVGLTTIITQYAFLLVALKIVGGLYLLWLGFKSMRSAATAKDLSTSAVALANNRAYFLRGLSVQMTNPKAAIANLAIVSIGVSAGAPWWVGTSIVLGATGLSLAAHLAYAVSFSTRPMVALYLKARRFVEAALGSFFCFLGWRLLNEELS